MYLCISVSIYIHLSIYLYINQISLFSAGRQTANEYRHRDPCRYLRGPPPVSTHPVVGRASVGARARRLSSAPACVCVCDPLDAAVTCPARRGCHSCDEYPHGAKHGALRDSYAYGCAVSPARTPNKEGLRSRARCVAPRASADAASTA